MAVEYITKLSQWQGQSVSGRAVKGYWRSLSIAAGSKLIRLALELGWARKPGRTRWPEIFSDNDFLAVTGIRAPRGAQICDDFDDVPSCAVPDHCKLKSILQRRLTQVLKEPLSGGLPLFVNLERFARGLDFSLKFGCDLFAFAS